MLVKSRSYRPSPAMGVASLALFVALGGTSYAVATGSIDSREIRNNTILSKDIHNDSVHGKDVRKSTLNSSDVADNSLRGADVRDNSLTGTDIGPNSMSGDELQPNSVSADEIQPNSIDTDELRTGAVGSSDLSVALLNPVMRVKTKVVPDGKSFGETASCEPGERAIAGGYNTPQVPPSGLTAISNGPTSFVSGSEATGGVATAWTVHVFNDAGGSVDLRVYVTCVRR